MFTHGLVELFHGHITYILQDEILEKARPFIDDIVIQGGRTKYLDKNGVPETIAENPGVRRYVYEHLGDLNCILHRLRKVGVTISAKKILLCVPEISILGHKCNQDGRIPDDSHVAKVLNWPICKNLTDVRGFLGVCNLLRIFIKDYAKKANTLNKLTRKNAKFEMGTEQLEAMEVLKREIANVPVLKPLDYKSGRPVYLAVDSSNIAVGWILFQEDENGKHHPVRYGSRTWKEHESCYSQSKLELFGLMIALKAVRPYVIGIKNLKVEVDAEYLKGMLNNPKETPNATLNRWVAIIKMFDFELIHIPADKHKALDGLSRRTPLPRDKEEVHIDGLEEWIDCQLENFYRVLKRDGSHEETEWVWFANAQDANGLSATTKNIEAFRDLESIKMYLSTLKFPDELTRLDRERILHQISRFYMKNDVLYWKTPGDFSQRVVTWEDQE